MKNIPGKSLLLFLLFVTLLNAKEHHYCSYKISATKSSVVLNEAVNIHFTTRQKTHNEVMFFDLKPQKSDDYEIISIKEKRHEFNYHDAKKEFEFLLLPKKSGKIDVKFDFQVRRASDDAVAQAYTGSRDNVKSIPTIKVAIDTPTIVLQVHELKHKVDAVGDFNLVMEIDKTDVSSYDKVNVVYKLQGRGFLEKSFEPIKELNGISIFRGIKEREPRATKDGYIYQKEWSYALVADKSYTLPTIILKTYNYRNKQYIDKKTESKKITVHTLDINTLLDDEEAPDASINYNKYIEYLYNVLLFLSGFLVAKFIEYLPKKLNKKKDCCAKIKSAKSAKELLKETTPFLTKVSLHEEVISLEKLVYSSNSKESFSKIKAKIIKKIQSK